MKFSIVIPAFNEEKLIGRTLDRVRAAASVFESAGHGFEIIVCDNNSTDRTSEIARRQGARVVFEPLNQIARARNAGASAATGGWLIFIDADSEPSPELFGEVLKAIQSDRYLAGGSTVRLDRRHLGLGLLTSGWNILSRAMRWAAGSFIFCEANAFRTVGGFSHELYASEELDLSQKLKKLARREGKSLIILHRHPLLTSARKADLYSLRDHFRFFLRLAIQPSKTLRSRGGCPIWYDGRR